VIEKRVRKGTFGHERERESNRRIEKIAVRSFIIYTLHQILLG
jgi:hypothetical protein